jgi:hypothetical protein
LDLQRFFQLLGVGSAAAIATAERQLLGRAMFGEVTPCWLKSWVLTYGKTEQSNMETQEPKNRM